MRKSGKDLLEREDVRIIIAERAYYKSERDGFPDGREDHYWLEAEREIVVEMNGKPTAEKTKAAQPTAKKPAPKKPASKKA
jgi:hypothetical protein